MIGACCSHGPTSLAYLMHGRTLVHRPLGRPPVAPIWTIGLAMADAAKPAAGAARIEDYRRDANLPARGHYLIRNAAVALTMDEALGDIAGCDVHVRNGEIVAVGPRLRADGAEVIDAAGTIVMPGFVDTHWHLWNGIFRGIVFLYGADLGYFPLKLRLGRHYTPADTYRAGQMALAEALFSGITTVHNWAHNIQAPEHADANILAQLDVGLRGRFSYGYTDDMLKQPETPIDLVDVARVQRDWFNGADDGLLTLGVALRGPENMAPEHRDTYVKEIETARKLGIPSTIHVAQHHAAAMKSQSITKLNADRLLGPDIQLIHAIHATPAEVEAMGATGTHLSLSPFTELQAGMGFPQTSEMIAAGVPISLSIDTIAAANADMFGVMRAILQCESARQRKRIFPPRKVIEMATIDGARDLGVADRTGSLTPGKRADVIMVRLDDVNMSSQPKANWPALIVAHAQPMNVDTVFADGRILKRKGQLTALDWDRVRHDAAASGAALLQRSGVDEAAGHA